METLELPAQSGQFVERFVAAFNSFDLDRIVSFYSADAVLNLGAGQVFRGRDAIRQVLSNFVAPGLPMRITPRFTVASGSTGLVSFDWLIEGNAPDGSPVRMSGTTSDVIRYESDGFWRQLLDHPFGSATTAN